ncbi:hypothetical protein Q581_02740, partial [Staphylococcus aureus M1532]
DNTILARYEKAKKMIAGEALSDG